MNLKPKTRREEFLYAIAEAAAGNDVEIPEAETRREEFLQAIAESARRVGGGGGGGAPAEKTWVLFSPEDDDVNFAIAEFDSLVAGTPVIVEWDTLKGLNGNELMRKLVHSSGTPCVGVMPWWGDEGIEYVCVKFLIYMGVDLEAPDQITEQYAYYNITPNGVEFYGYTHSETISLQGGTLNPK